MLNRYIVYLIIAHYVRGVCCKDVPYEKRSCCNFNFGQTRLKSTRCTKDFLFSTDYTNCTPHPTRNEHSTCYQIQDVSHCYPKNCNMHNRKCIVKTKPDTYHQSKCPYNYALTVQDTSPTWYPARRIHMDFDYGIGEFMVEEIGKDYGTVVKNYKYLPNGAISKSNCLFQKGGVITAAPCDKQFGRSCEYGSLKENKFGYCNERRECFNAQFNTSSLKCLCVEDFSEWCSLADTVLDFVGALLDIRYWCQQFFEDYESNPDGVLNAMTLYRNDPEMLRNTFTRKELLLDKNELDHEIIEKEHTNLPVSKSLVTDSMTSTSQYDTDLHLATSSQTNDKSNAEIPTYLEKTDANLQLSKSSRSNDKSNPKIQTYQEISDAKLQMLKSSRTNLKIDASNLQSSQSYDSKFPETNLFSSLQCKVCERDFPYEYPTRNFTRNGSMLEITFYNYKSLVLTEGGRVFCMTDGIEDGLVRRLDVNQRYHKNMVNVSIVAKSSGHYWCEGFEVKNFQKIATDQIWVDAENVYPIDVVVRYRSGEDPTHADIAYGKYIKSIQDAYNSNFGLYDVVTLNIKVKWMKTVHVDESNYAVTYLLHICRQFGWDFHDKYYWQLKKNLPEVLSRLPFIIKFSDLYSSLYCMQKKDYQEGVAVTWPQTLIEHSATSQEVCLSIDGTPVTRRCGGKYFIGGRWDQAEACYSPALVESEVTHNLNETLHSNLTTPEIIHNLTELTANVSNYKPIDIYLVSSIILKAKPEEVDPENITRILNRIMSADQSVLRQSQSSYNATDRILYSFDLILSANKYQQIDQLLETDNLISFTFDANATDYAGLALIRNSEGFEICKLLRNTSLESLLDKAGLEVVTYFPDTLLVYLAAEHPKIIINVFLNNALFHDKEKKSVARNFGILLDDNSTLPANINLLFKPEKNITKGACGFWNYGFDTEDQPMFGKWDIDNDAIDYKSFQSCEFWHVTHFGLLISEKIIIADTYILELITNIESILSLLGFSGIFVTAAFFKTWRGNRGNRILLHYSFISFLQIVLLYLSQMIYRSSSYFLCVIIGACLHFTLISQFCWMLVISYLQYKRYVTVFQGSQKFMLVKAFVISYFFPIIPISLLLVFYIESYTIGTGDLCYPTGYGLMFGVLVPVSVVLLSNIIIFARIVVELFCLRRNKCVDDDIFLLRLRLVVLMFFMLGITWVLGFAAQIFESPTLLYAFCSTATLQGFVIFLFFIVFNKNTRIMYVYMWKKYHYW